MSLTKYFFVLTLVLSLTACMINPSQLNQDRAAAARLKLGLAYLEQAKNNSRYLDLAYHNLKLAENYSPNNVFVLFGLAQFYHQVGEINIADTFYRRVLEQNIEQGNFFIYYGRFLCQTKKYNEAQDYFNRVIVLNHYQWKVEALEQSAYCALLAKDSKKAKKQFANLFRLAPLKRSEAKKMVRLYEKDKRVEAAHELKMILK